MTIFILDCETISKQNCKFLTAKFTELQVAPSVVKFGVNYQELRSLLSYNTDGASHVSVYVGKENQYVY